MADDLILVKHFVLLPMSQKCCMNNDWLTDTSFLIGAVTSTHFQNELYQGTEPELETVSRARVLLWQLQSTNMESVNCANVFFFHSGCELEG